MEQTLLLIKPDATIRNLTGEILQIIERNGFIIEHLRMFYMSDELAEKFYAEHQEKYFYNRLIGYMKSNRLVAVILQRQNAVEKLRELVGNTDFCKARIGTIRSLYAESITRNSVHASDSVAQARREIDLVFPEINKDRNS